jgi:hypothetical protein
MMKYWILFKRWLANIRNKGNLAESPGPGPSTNGSRDIEIVKGLVGMIEKTQEIEIDCSQVYRLLDQYTELVLRGEDPGQLLPLVKQHLELCMDCREEYEVLLKILEADKQ